MSIWTRPFSRWHTHAISTSGIPSSTRRWWNRTSLDLMELSWLASICSLPSSTKWSTWSLPSRARSIMWSLTRRGRSRPFLSQRLARSSRKPSRAPSPRFRFTWPTLSGVRTRTLSWATWCMHCLSFTRARRPFWSSSTKLMSLTAVLLRNGWQIFRPLMTPYLSKIIIWAHSRGLWA